MANEPTETARQTIQSSDGNDVLQIKNSAGKVVFWIDANGVVHISTTAMTESVQTIGKT